MSENDIAKLQSWCADENYLVLWRSDADIFEKIEAVVQFEETAPGLEGVITTAGVLENGTWVDLESIDSSQVHVVKHVDHRWEEWP